MNENVYSILIIALGTLLCTVFAIFFIMFTALQKRKQFKYKLEKQDMEHRFSNELMQTRLEVQEQTLRHFSDELHDNVAQMLGIAKMNLHELIHRTPEEHKKMAQASADMVGEAIKDIRAMSHSMNGSMVLKTGLKESIERDIHHISLSKRISCNFKIEGDEYTLGEDRELLVFRIIQEAISNAVKHGQPDSINISLLYEPHLLKVTIADNGNGFNADNAVSKHSGLGLSNIRHRVGMLEGSVDIASAVQQGTTVTLYIPHKQ